MKEKRNFYKTDCKLYIAMEQVDENGFVEFFDERGNEVELNVVGCELVEVEILADFYTNNILCLKIEEDEEEKILYKCSKIDNKSIFTRGVEQ
jgi:hypothetical protein